MVDLLEGQMRPEKRQECIQTSDYFIINPLHTEHVLSAKVIYFPAKLLPLSQQALIDGQRATNVTECSAFIESEFNVKLQPVTGKLSIT